MQPSLLEKRYWLMVDSSHSSHTDEIDDSHTIIQDRSSDYGSSLENRSGWTGRLPSFSCIHASSSSSGNAVCDLDAALLGSAGNELGVPEREWMNARKRPNPSGD